MPYVLCGAQAPNEIAEALRICGLGSGPEAPVGPQPGGGASVVRQVEQAQAQAAAAPALNAHPKDVNTAPPRVTTQPMALSTQAATQGYMANLGASQYLPQPSLVVGYSGAHGRAPMSAPHPLTDTRHFTKPITGAPVPDRVQFVAPVNVGAAVPRARQSPAPNFQPQFSVGTSSRAGMNNSRKSTQWGDANKNAVGSLMGLGTAFDDHGGQENVGNGRRPTSGRRAGQAYGSWTRQDLNASMNLGNAGSGARRATAAQKMYDTAPKPSTASAAEGAYSGSGGYGRQGKFSQEQSLYRPRPDLIQHNVSYHPLA